MITVWKQPPRLAGLFGPLIAVSTWAIIAVLLQNPILLPSPSSVLRRLIRDFSSPLFWSATANTVTEALLGAGLAVVIALPLAYIVYKVPLVDAAFSPLIAFSQAIPAVALAPLLVIWLGYGLLPIAVLCALIVFFPILTTSVLGFKSLPQAVLEAARIDGASAFSLLVFIEAPLALPALLTGLRTGFTLAMIGAVVGEFIMGGKGLGNRLSLQSSAVDMTGLFATVVVLCVLAFTFARIIIFFEHLWLKKQR